MNIRLLIPPRAKDLGGFTVRRLLPHPSQRMVGPWIFFDHLGPAEFAAGTGIDVRPHPHINLATVTYLFEGEILHRDSVGSRQLIHPGDINLMVAGRGITHSERERPEVRAVDHRVAGLQLWLALPTEQEEIEPAFYHYPAAAIPVVHVAGVPVRVMMGRAYGVESPVRTFSATLYLEARLKPGQTLRLPPAAEAGLYVVEGQVTVAGREVPAQHLLTMTDSDSAEVVAQKDATLAVVGGESVGERHIDWNFVSSRRARIDAAKAAWRAGDFPTVVGDEHEFIPLP